MNTKRTLSIFLLVAFSLMAIDFTVGLRKKFIGHRRWNPEGLPGFPTQKPPHRPPILPPLLPLPNQPTRVPPLLPIKLPHQSPPMLPPTLKPTCNCCCHPCPCDSTPSIDSLKLIKSHKL